MEGVFRLICAKLGLYTINRLVDAGGRAVVIAPCLKDTKDKIAEIQALVDDFCITRFMGELTINLSFVSACGLDLITPGFSTLPGKLNEKVNIKKQTNKTLIYSGEQNNALF